MNKKAMMVGLAGCLMAGSVLWAEEAAKPKPEGQPGGRRGDMMMDGGEMGDPMLARALAPNSFMAKELNLTPEQEASLKTIFKDQNTEMMALREKMKEASVKQAELMAQDMPDEAAVMKGIETIGAIRVATAKLLTGKMLAAVRVLTPEQRAKMQALLKERREKTRQQMQEMRNRQQDQRRERRKEGKTEETPPPAAPQPAPQPAPKAE